MATVITGQRKPNDPSSHKHAIHESRNTFDYPITSLTPSVKWPTEINWIRYLQMNRNLLYRSISRRHLGNSTYDVSEGSKFYFMETDKLRYLLVKDETNCYPINVDVDLFKTELFYFTKYFLRLTSRVVRCVLAAAWASNVRSICRQSRHLYSLSCIIQ